MTEIEIKVCLAYLRDSKSHRSIQEEILGIPAPLRGGGYEAMRLLHSNGIYGHHKGRFPHATRNNLQEILRNL